MRNTKALGGEPRAATAAVGLHRDGERGARARSILLMVGGVTLFSGLDASVKFVARDLPVFEITWLRYLIQFLLVIAILNPIRAPEAWRVRRPWLQVVRASMLMLMSLFNFLALRQLQLAETVSINFLSPLMITLLSVLFLGERIGLHRIGAIVVGFAGVLLVTRPGLGSFEPAMIYSVLAMVAGSLYAMLTRTLAASESPGSMLLVMAGVPSLLLLPVQPFIFVMPPDALSWGLLFMAGLLGTVGHFMLILAHRYAPASVLAPFGYAQIVPMVLIGYLAFADVPTAWTLAGGGLVIASGLYLFHRESLLARRAEAASRPK